MRGTIYIIKIAAKCIQVVVVKCPIPDKISYYWETIYMALEVQISKPIKTKYYKCGASNGETFSPIYFIYWQSYSNLQCCGKDRIMMSFIHFYLQRSL